MKKKQLTLKKEKADAFVLAMNTLSDKFNYKYIDGKLEDAAKLDLIDGKMELTFIKPVPEMVRHACTMAFVNTLL